MKFQALLRSSKDMTHRLSTSFFQGKHLAILGLMTVSLLSFGSSQSFAQTMITMGTDNTSYGPGNTIKINGHVSNSSNKLVAVQVNDPAGNTIMVRTVKTDENSNFVIQFKLPSTAVTGNYKIITNANIEGRIITQNTEISETTAVPEFNSMAPIVFIIAIISILALSTKTKTKLKI